MQKLSEEQLLARDAKRDLNAELLESINDLSAGKVGRIQWLLALDKSLNRLLPRRALLLIE